MKPEIGTVVPSFSLAVCGGEFGEEGSTLTQEDLKGRWVVLYFYPKDDTPGCTKQACALRDSFDEISQIALVLGVSIDSIESHQKFIAKHDLPFALLSDPEKDLVEKLGVWVEKSMYGKKYMGVERSTFLLNPEGKIAAILEKIQPAKHLENVLKELQSLQS